MNILLVSQPCQPDADTFGATAFHEDAGCLEYTVSKDGAVQLSDQPFLQVKLSYPEAPECCLIQQMHGFVNTSTCGLMLSMLQRFATCCPESGMLTVSYVCCWMYGKATMLKTGANNMLLPMWSVSSPLKQNLTTHMSCTHCIMISVKRRFGFNAIALTDSSYCPLPPEVMLSMLNTCLIKSHNLHGMKSGTSVMCPVAGCVLFCSTVMSVRNGKLCAVLQHLKVSQDIIVTVFTNPLYVAALALCPWHPTAKRNKAALAALQQVPSERALAQVIVPDFV